MGKKLKDYQDEAKGLGIETEGLTINQLRSEIKKQKESQSNKEESSADSKESDEEKAKDGKDDTNEAADSKKEDTSAGESKEEKKEEKAESDNKENATVLKHRALKAEREKKAKEAKKSEKAKKAKAEEAKALAEKPKAKKDNRPVFEDDRGLKFRFKETAPKSINVDGRSVKVSEAIEDKEIMLELVYGNSNFIEQIYS